MDLRNRLRALERRRTEPPVAVEFQGRDETEADFAARLRAAYGDPPRCKIIAFSVAEAETPPRDNS